MAQYKGHCDYIPRFFKQIKKILELSNENLINMSRHNFKKDLQNIILLKFSAEMRESEKKGFIPSQKIEDMSAVDIYHLLGCLKFAQEDGCTLLNVRYDTIGIYVSPYSNPWNAYEGLLREARSTIINLQNDEIVSLPYWKFFNINEIEECSQKEVEKKIENCQELTVMDKLDGSFIQITRYKDKTLIGTSSTFSLFMKKQEGNDYLNIAIEYFQNDDYSQVREMVKNNPNLTFIFELIDTRVPNVVQYSQSKNGLYLLGARNKNTGEVYTPNQIKSWNKIKKVENYNLTLKEILEICKNGNANEREGFVLNIDGFLIKIKLDEFFLLNKINGGFNFRTILSCFKDGTLDDMLSKLPLNKKINIDMAAKAFACYKQDMAKTINGIVSYEKKQKRDIKDVVMNFKKKYPPSWFDFLIKTYRKGDGACLDFLNFKKEEDFKKALNILEDWKKKE